jgi:hypothetical protein
MHCVLCVFVGCSFWHFMSCCCLDVVTMYKELGSGLQTFRSSNFQKVECSNPQTLKGPHSLMLVLTMLVW